jgi:hypothetical protein
MGNILERCKEFESELSTCQSSKNDAMGWDVHVRLTAQVYENYGSPDALDHWKPKGGHVFLIPVNSDYVCFLPKSELMSRLNLLLERHSSDLFRYEYVDHEVLFSQDELLTTRLEDVESNNITV